MKAGDVIGTSVLSASPFDGVCIRMKQNTASPPLVVAYALAGSLDMDLLTEPLGTGNEGQPVFLKDIWPMPAEVADFVHKYITSEMFKRSYAGVFDGDERWRAIKVPAGQVYSWDAKSTYVKNPPYFDGMTMTPAASGDIMAQRRSRCWETRDHDHSAPQAIAETSAAKYLRNRECSRRFNQYGARRGIQG